MTKQEKCIVSAYTGVLMCDFDDLQQYLEKLLGRRYGRMSLLFRIYGKKSKKRQSQNF